MVKYEETKQFSIFAVQDPKKTLKYSCQPSDKDSYNIQLKSLQSVISAVNMVNK